MVTALLWQHNVLCFLYKRAFTFNIDVFLHKKKSPISERFTFIEPTMRFELTTSSLPRKRSTPELRRQLVFPCQGNILSSHDTALATV